MRLPLACMQCFRERGQPDEVLYYAEVTDDGLYHLPCRNGHVTTTCLQEQKFEVLYELAANAILDGYYREAVVSFTSSLESFYEFYLRVIARKRNVAEETFEEAWKRIVAQSERQLGAYTFIHTLEQGSPPPHLTESQIKFRNKVIHRGTIPTRTEAEDYGQKVLDAIVPVLVVLQVNEATYVSQEVVSRLRRLNARVPPSQHRSTMSMPGAISMARALSEPQPSLLQALSELKKRRDKIGW
jgi:hypothetical protein